MKTTQAASGAATNWYVKARYGLFIHYGLYSLLGRGEWALNREQIPLAEYQALAQKFTAKNFDAGVAGRAKEFGDARALGQFPNQRVLAAAAADDEDFHKLRAATVGKTRGDRNREDGGK